MLLPNGNHQKLNELASASLI